MTNPEDPTQQLGGAADQGASEPTQAFPAQPPADPTQVIPTSEPTQAISATPEPTRVIPTSGWARPAEGQWPANGSAQTPTPYGQQSYGPQAYGQQAYGQAYPQYPPQYGYGRGQGEATRADATPGATPGAAAGSGAGTQAYGPYAQNQYAQNPYGYNPYAQPGQQGYAQYPSGYGQHPGYYPPNQYYYQPQTTRATKRRWPVAMVALLLALLLGAGGFVWAANQLGASPTSSVTTDPQTDPQSGTSGGGQTDPWQNGQSGQQGGSTTTSNGVTAAQSAGIVLIEAQTSSGVAAGTGMILSADGKVLTNYHVVAGSEKLSVTVADSGDTYSATVLGFDQTRDVALIQLKDASGLTTVKTDTSTPSVGTAVDAVGNAEGGGELVKASGKVTGTNQSLTVSSDSPWGNTEDLSGLIETNARAVPGDSGGPMYDSDSEVVGMTTAGSTKEHTSYAVPIATALAVVQQVETGQDAGTVRVGPAGYLGIKVADSDQTGNGKTITAVVEGSPAASAGVVAGSHLTKVGSTSITANTNLATVIRAMEPGQKVTIEWTTPGGAHKSATVTLGSSPVN
jgi:S1-C subfamily serine protease